jgi:hypothetical protein
MTENILIATPTTLTTLKKKGQNKGEKAEVEFKKELFNNRNNPLYLVPIFGEDASEGIQLIDSSTNKPCENLDQIKKAKSTSKADVTIIFNNTKIKYDISIKSETGAKPSILNHTPRSAKAFQESLKDDIINIDKIASEYITKRSNGVIKEDVKLCKLETYKDEENKSSFIKLLVYFIFIGTGSKRSETECNSVILIHKNNNISFIPCITEEEKESYVKSIINNCVLSFRSKGMPTKKNDLCNQWVYVNPSGKECGSLHIRLGNSDDLV